MKFTALWLSVIWVLSACQGISSQVEPVALSSSDQPGQVQQPGTAEKNNEIAPPYVKYKNHKLNKVPLISSGYASTRNQGYTSAPFKKTEKPEPKPISVDQKQSQPINVQRKPEQPIKAEQKLPQPMGINQQQAQPTGINQLLVQPISFNQPPLQPISVNQLQAQPITKRPFDPSFYKPTTYVPKVPLTFVTSTTRPVAAPTPTPFTSLAPSSAPEFNFEIKGTPKPFWTSNGESKPSAVAGEVLDELPDIIYDYDDERNQGEGVLFLVNQPQPQSVAPVPKNPPVAAPTKAPTIEGQVFNSAPFQQPPAAAGGFKFPPQRDPTPPPKPGKPSFRFPDPNPPPVISSRQDLPNVLPHFRPNANPPPEFTETLTVAQQGQPLWLGQNQPQRQDLWPLREGVGRPAVREPQRSPLSQLSQKMAGLFGKKPGSQQRISSRQGEVDASDRRPSSPAAPLPSAADLRRRERPYLVVGPQQGPPPQVAGAKLVHTALASQPHQPQRRQTPPLRQPPPPPPPQQQSSPVANQIPSNTRVVPIPARVPLNPVKDVAVPQVFEPKLIAASILPIKPVKPVQEPALEFSAALPLIKAGHRPFPAAPKAPVPSSSSPPALKPSTLVGFTAPQEAPDGNQVSVVHPAYIVKYSDKPEPPRLVNLDAPFFPSVAGPSETNTYPSGSFDWYVVNNGKSTGRDSEAAGSESQAVAVNEIKNREPVFESGFVPFVPGQS